MIILSRTTPTGRYCGEAAKSESSQSSYAVTDIAPRKQPTGEALMFTLSQASLSYII